jgi:large subunit ribosomal protein L6
MLAANLFVKYIKLNIMSRIGKKLITLPADVLVSETKGLISVKGPKGQLSFQLHPHVKFAQKDNQLFLSIVDITNKKDKALWGTNRQLVNNMVVGVSQGYVRQLEINGVGYKAEVKGNSLTLYAGFSHPVNFVLPPEVTAKVEKNLITLESINKEVLGETASRLRQVRKPEPYKGKGIKYLEEVIIRKAGKKVKTTSA